MKTPLFLGLALLALAPAQAQVFRPAAVNGAILGGIAGAVIGHNSGSLHHNGWQGAAIGAGAGLLLGGAAADNAGYGYGYGNGYYGVADYSGGYVYRRGPGRGAYYGGGYGYGGAAYDGLWLGALAGGIVGHNSGGDWRYNGWRGAAWGAGVGWLLGSIVDANAYYSYPRSVVVREAPVIQAQPQTAAAPQQVTIVNNYYGNAAPMSSANSLFGR